jgi:hypothetical protein
MSRPSQLTRDCVIICLPYANTGTGHVHRLPGPVKLSRHIRHHFPTCGREQQGCRCEVPVEHQGCSSQAPAKGAASGQGNSGSRSLVWRPEGQRNIDVYQVQAPHVHQVQALHVLYVGVLLLSKLPCSGYNTKACLLGFYVSSWSVALDLHRTHVCSSGRLVHESSLITLSCSTDPDPALGRTAQHPGSPCRVNVHHTWCVLKCFCSPLHGSNHHSAADDKKLS